MSSTIRCTCCQSELTQPQFYNGYVYGMTCIKKVDPAFKTTKTVYVVCEAFKVVSSGSRNVVNVKVAGKVYQIVCYGDIENRTTTTFMQDGILFVAQDKIK